MAPQASLWGESFTTLSKLTQLLSCLPSLLLNLLVLSLFLFSKSSRSFPLQMVSVISLCDLVNQLQYVFILVDYAQWPTQTALCQAEATFNQLGHQSRNLFVFMVTLCIYLSANKQWGLTRLRSFMNIYAKITVVVSVVFAVLPLGFGLYGFNLHTYTCTGHSIDTVIEQVVVIIFSYLPNAIMTTANLVLLVLIVQELRVSALDQETKHYIHRLLVFPMFQSVTYILYFVCFILLSADDQPTSAPVLLMLLISYVLDNLQGFVCVCVFCLNGRFLKSVQDGMGRYRMASRVSSDNSSAEGEQYLSLQPQEYIYEAPSNNHLGGSFFGSVNGMESLRMFRMTREDKNSFSMISNQKNSSSMVSNQPPPFQ